MVRVIWQEVFQGKRMQVADAAALKDSTDSLKSMLTSFFQRTHPEWSMDDVKAHVAALDMEPVSQKYVDRVVCW